jgi:hypothetical protein
MKLWVLQSVKMEREKKDIDTDSKHEHEALCCMCRTGLVLFCTLIGKKIKVS